MGPDSRTFRVAIMLRSDEDRIREYVGNQYLGCIFDYYSIGTLNELRDTFMQIKGSYDGVLTSGLFSDRFIGYYGGSEGIRHGYFSATVENYYHQILLQTMHRPDLKLEEIRLDLMTREHDLPSIIEGNRLGPLMWEERLMINRMSPAQVIDYEKEMIARHTRAICSGEYKLFMTRSTIATAAFRESNVEHLYVNLTGNEIFDTVTALRHEMELQALKDSQIASICLSLGEHTSAQERESAKKAIDCFEKTKEAEGLMFSAGENGFEALTDAQTIYDLTRENTCCSLTGFFRRQTGYAITVGYGIGTTVQGARENALTAAQYGSTGKMEQAFLVGSDGQIKALRTDVESGPVEMEERPAGNIFSSAVTEIAKHSHLASATVFNLLMLIKKHRRQEVSSDWLMKEMGVSLRMANKILSHLEKAGYAHVCGKSLISARGRPSNVYRLYFGAHDENK